MAVRFFNFFSDLLNIKNKKKKKKRNNYFKIQKSIKAFEKFFAINNRNMIIFGYFLCLRVVYKILTLFDEKL